MIYTVVFTPEAEEQHIRPGLHITNFRGHAVIAFTVDADRVSIIGVFYGGRDFEALLQPGDE